ncbi:MAG: hypothetical protein ACYC9Q_08420 [Bacillota bacterium]
MDLKSHLGVEESQEFAPWSRQVVTNPKYQRTLHGRPSLRSLLVERCPACGRPVTHKALHYGVCDCGMALTDFPLVAPGTEGAAAQRIIQNRLTMEAQGEEIRRSAVWFNSFNFLHRVFDNFPLGSLAVDGFENREADKGTRSRSRSIETDYVYCTLAVNVLAGGKKSLPTSAGAGTNSASERPFEPCRLKA